MIDGIDMAKGHEFDWYLWSKLHPRKESCFLSPYHAHNIMEDKDPHQSLQLNGVTCLGIDGGST